MSRILIVDDEPAIGWSLRELLCDDGHSVELAASVEAAIDTCSRFTPDVLLLDVRLPGRDGLSAMPEFRTLAPHAAIVVMTAFGDLDSAVRAVQAGAFEYLVKPFDLNRVSDVVSRALADRASEAVPAMGAARASVSPSLALVGSSLPMQRVFQQIALVAPSDLPALITGDTGTGKELAARAIHAHSHRRNQSLVTTSLASLAASVIESELFGHVRGAFTGATADRQGLFELADGGTIFLDEIGDAPPEVQVKLLRVLEHREIVPVGSAAVRSVNVRVIAATNRDLTAAMASGHFREDLYHRLRVFPIHMPSLSTRLEDVPALVACFLDRHSHVLHVPAVSAAFLAAACARPWPGNVRELKHAVEYANVVARGSTLRPEHLPPTTNAFPVANECMRPTIETADQQMAAAIEAWITAVWQEGESESGSLHARLIQLAEAILAREAVQRTGGNRTAAAKMLGLDRATLREKLKR